MKVTVRQVDRPEKEQVVLECVKFTKDMDDICNYARAKGDTIMGYGPESKMIPIRKGDIIYIEAVGELVFAYLKDAELELRMRLYEAEELLAQNKFIRCSKSIVVNVLKIEWIKPALNGRFHALLENGETVVISRQYGKKVKQYIMEEL